MKVQLVCYKPMARASRGYWRKRGAGVIPGHGCNACCAGDLHCDLVYSEGHPDERLPRYSLARHYDDRYGVRVERYQEARA